MKIRETVNQIKNEFLFNANDFMVRIDRTQQFITFSRGWKVKENVKPSQVSVYLDTKGYAPITQRYFALDIQKPYFQQNANCSMSIKGAGEFHYYTHNNETGAKEHQLVNSTSPYSGKWVCRHYAVLDIMLRYKGLKGAHSVKRVELFNDEPRMREYLWDRAMIATWVNWLCHEGATDRYWVEMNGKTDFLYDQFKAMKMPARGEKVVLPMVINAWYHAMTLTLKITHRKDGTVQYSVSFYDPNLTYNHRKMRFNSLKELRAFDWQSLIPPKVISSYGNFTSASISKDEPIQWVFSPLPEKKLDELIDRFEWSDEQRLAAQRQSKEINYPLIKAEK